MLSNTVKPVLKRILPARLRLWLRTRRARYAEWPPYGWVSFGSLRRTTPIHRGFGFGRGRYIDRYYIENFLEHHAASIAGDILELSENTYAMRFGKEKVLRSDILDVRPNYPAATIVADLTSDNSISDNRFDCIILTQVLNFIYDARSAVRTIHRILKPGGTVLVSVSGISQIAQDELQYCGDYWRFTSSSLRRLFEEFFPPENVAVEAHGNLLAAIAFLHGLAVEELTPEELDIQDPQFEVSILLKAVKPRQDSSGLPLNESLRRPPNL